MENIEEVTIKTAPKKETKTTITTSLPNSESASDNDELEQLEQELKVRTAELLADIRKKMARGQFSEAINGLTSINQTCSTTSQEVSNREHKQECLYLLACCYRYQNQFSHAFEHLALLQKMSPDFGRIFQEKAHCYLGQNQPQLALENYQLAVKRNNGLLASWQQIQKLSANKEERETAEHNINYLTSLPKVLMAVVSLINEKKLKQAEEYCRNFLRDNPTHVEAIRLLAQIAEKNNVLDDAEQLLKNAIKIEPNNAWLQFDHANILFKRQKFSAAHQAVCALIDQLPAHAPQINQVRLLFANTLSALAKYQAAIAEYQKLLTTEPNNLSALMQLGHNQKTLGRTDEAIENYNKAISFFPNYGDAYWSLANLKTYQFSQKQITQMQTALRSSTATIEDKIHLNFALGKAFEDTKKYQQSFEYYQSGNQLKQQQTRYNSQVMLNNFELQKQAFSEPNIQQLARSDASSSEPIFIVGMPRAGSTLLEQILSSHSLIDATFELPFISAFSHELNRKKHSQQQLEAPEQYPKSVLSLSRQQLTELGQNYLAEAQVFRQGAPYFIDKMPNNFRHIGLIKSILPNAKIIDIRRPAVSCCFSNFKQLYGEGQEFSYSLKDVIEYYQGYVSLMTHWHQIYPNQILTLDYQQLVSSPEESIKSVLDYLGLELENACFDFHNSPRAVRTPSAEQVRQPINKKGLEQWRNFEPYLTELIKAFS